MIRSIRQIGALGLLLGLLVAGVGCGRGVEPVTEVLLRDDQLAEALASGIALAPTASLQPSTESAQIAAAFSNALYIESMTQLRGIDVVSPDFVLERLGEAGEQRLEQFRKLRRRLVRDDRVPLSLAAQILDTLRERYLLVTWADEKQVVGLEDMPGDYVDVDFSVDVQRASYAQVDGWLVGCLIDLQTNRILWRAQARYRSGRDFAREEGDKTGEQLAREQGAYELIGLLRDARL